MNTLKTFILFDDAVAQQATLLDEFVRHETLHSSQLSDLDSTLNQGWETGLHAAIFIPYEFGQAGDAAATAHAPLHIHWFSRATALAHEQIDAWLAQRAHAHDPQDQAAGLCNLQLKPGFDSYRQQFERLREAIARGDFYQINYTVRQSFNTYGSPISIYRALRAKQPVPYGVLAWLPHLPVEPWTLCLSPELFIRIDEDGAVRAEPMKGTLPYSEGEPLDIRSEQLRADPKNRAENLMIVDLLRNDLSMLARPGGVQVEELFKVTRFGQVLQMTTPIRCDVRAQVTMANVIEALFPCGSITGAPKKMSMRYIADSETGPRGLYTGSIGYLQPAANSLRARGCFNVAIRTLCLQPMDDHSLACEGVMGVGGGLVYDSTAQSEYEEIHWKSRFLRDLPAWFQIFETMLVQQGRCVLLEQHIERLCISAYALGFVADKTALTKQVQQAISEQSAHASLRMRAVLFQNGKCDTQFFALDSAVAATPTASADQGAQATTRIASRILPNHDPLRRFKTTWRQHYDDDLKHAVKSGDFDVLYFNHDGYLLEGARSSVFIHHDGAWITPELSLDILPGVMRAQVLMHPEQYLGTDHVSQTQITESMLHQADAIVLTNALRGCIPVRLIAR